MLGTSDAGFLRNILARKGVNRPGKGTIRAGQDS